MGQPVDLREGRAIVAEQDQRVVVQLLRPGRGAALGEVLLGCDDVPLQRHQVALHQVRLLRRVHADRHVRLPHRQVQIRVVEQQRHRHVGVGGQEPAEPRRQPVRPEPDRRGHLQPPGRLLLAFGQQRLRHRQLGEHVAHRAVEALALLGQDQAAGVAMEQRDLQVLLQRRDLSAHGGLAEVQRIARVGEAAGFRDSVEHPQLVPVHRRSSFPIRSHVGQSNSLRLGVSRESRLFHSQAPIICSVRASRARIAGLGECSARNFSASSAAMHPMPAAVTAWR